MIYAKSYFSKILKYAFGLDMPPDFCATKPSRLLMIFFYLRHGDGFGAGTCRWFPELLMYVMRAEISCDKH